MFRNRVRTAEILLATVVVAGSVYVMDAVVGGGLVHPPYAVTVDLAGSGGLYPGAQVAYRGNGVGKVTDLELTPTGVEATLAIEQGVRIPRDTQVFVANLSAIGEQRIDFRPRTDAGPYLAEGDHVAAKDTALPLPTYEFLDHVAHLTKQVDVRDMKTVVAELQTAVGDPDVDLRRIYDQGDQTLTALEQMRASTMSLVERGQTPLQTMSDNADGLAEFSRNVDAIARSLHQANPDLHHLVDSGGGLTMLLTDTLDRNAPTLARLLAQGRTVLEVAARRQPALITWLDYVTRQAIAMIEGTRDGSGRVLLVPNASPLCQYATHQRSPLDTEHRPPVRDGHCSVVDPRVQQRGAQYVPRP